MHIKIATSQFRMGVGNVRQVMDPGNRSFVKRVRVLNRCKLCRYSNVCGDLCHQCPFSCPIFMVNFIYHALVNWLDYLNRLYHRQQIKIYFMGNLLYIIAVILVIGWAVGFLGYAAGGIIHLLLVIAVILVLLRIIGGSSRA